MIKDCIPETAEGAGQPLSGSHYRGESFGDFSFVQKSENDKISKFNDQETTNDVPKMSRSLSKTDSMRDLRTYFNQGSNKQLPSLTPVQSEVDN